MVPDPLREAGCTEDEQEHSHANKRLDSVNPAGLEVQCMQNRVSR